MSDLNVITKQVYKLRGDKKTNGTYAMTEINILDENTYECAAVEMKSDGKHFLIIQKGSDEKLNQYEAEMISDGKPVTGVGYIESNDGNVWFVRYLIGSQKDKAALSDFFKAVQERISKDFGFRGWSVNGKGELTITKGEYFY